MWSDDFLRCAFWWALFLVNHKTWLLFRNRRSDTHKSVNIYKYVWESILHTPTTHNPIISQWISWNTVCWTRIKRMKRRRHQVWLAPAVIQVPGTWYHTPYSNTHDYNNPIHPPHAPPSSTKFHTCPFVPFMCDLYLQVTHEYWTHTYLILYLQVTHEYLTHTNLHLDMYLIYFAVNEPSQ